MRRVQAHVFGIPFVDLKEKQIDVDVLSLIPEPIARNHNIIAYKQGEDALEVAMLDVDDLKAIDFVEKKTGYTIKPRLTDEESVRSALLQYQQSLQSEFGDIIQEQSKEIEDSEIAAVDQEDEDISEEELKDMAEDLPVVRIVDTLLKHAILQDASDIHIEPMEEKVLVRYRIDGVLHDAMTLPDEAASSIAARIKILAKLKLDEKRLPQDGRFKMETKGREVSFRVSILPTQYGEKIVLRLLRQNVAGFTLESLGFHGEGLDRVHWATKQKTGMVLTCGPTGSGKTTTLYTILDILNTPKVNISTLEDPVEYQMKRINQTQVKPDIGFDFSTGLRSLVRQDPDIIMVGEIRDAETASLAINAALTGHLVLSTLHTNSAAGAIPRLLDMGAKSFLIVSTIRVIIGQRLVRLIQGEKEEYFLDDEQLAELNEIADMDRVLKKLQEENEVDASADWSDVSFYRVPEEADPEKVYSGRRGIQEVLQVTETIKEMISADATADEIEQQAKDEGMLTMAEDGIFKAAKGFTTLEEVLRVVSE
ncbi:MAG: hypothetical protein BRC24_01525 [Parcubacteria group bacterium SW_4_46_8]|nr:MAG: hypothetical protein BRC24_01525 [Parcubacteria group bacterium SW_4_46_8]